MDDREDAVPGHDTDLDQVPGPIGADEHDHVVVLADVGDREPQRVQHVVFGDPVTLRRLDDDRLLSARLLEFLVSIVAPVLGLLFAHH
ncbi:MAG: hypothetical protein ACK5MT_15505 [Actinomycetales bacterium]